MIRNRILKKVIKVFLNHNKKICFSKLKKLRILLSSQVKFIMNYQIELKISMNFKLINKMRLAKLVYK